MQYIVADVLLNDLFIELLTLHQIGFMGSYLGTSSNYLPDAVQTDLI